MRLWRGLALVAICGAILVMSNPASRAQQEQPESHRKMLSKVMPVYPDLAKRMGMAGSVKIEAVVAPNGTVKSAEILGGHPLLAQAAVDAVRRCKWETGPHETREVIVLNFHP